ncbi:MAG: AbrB/MazE/SpoVT family DNA-binding domain-containing protein [Microbacterium sp.]|jgi:AbrB family looped-hinge helix DNA binding protein|uniref:AbrB/MazE/SpoVT family DNA-binding domain-containing protein n=1 Tax=Microbacterium sp. TaxID=51671 RepID=UPI0025CCD667|nr:AbrB/MazE/SpoVT family DNA-binding domain-containing protein [Microbacterium sp.]MBQ9918680.1 AbrB/MazE/SpoVT family DNA-binding domain-containing protein [Microbacterium sp.]
MELTIDSGGRIVLPKLLRDAYGLLPGTTVDISAYGTGLQITPGGRTARVVRERGGRLVAQGTTPVSDDIVSALIDAGRR